MVFDIFIISTILSRMTKNHRKRQNLKNRVVKMTIFKRGRNIQWKTGLVFNCHFGPDMDFAILTKIMILVILVKNDQNHHFGVKNWSKTNLNPKITWGWPYENPTNTPTFVIMTKKVIWEFGNMSKMTKMVILTYFTFLHPFCHFYRFRR